MKQFKENKVHDLNELVRLFFINKIDDLKIGEKLKYKSITYTLIYRSDNRLTLSVCVGSQHLNSTLKYTNEELADILVSF